MLLNIYGTVGYLREYIFYRLHLLERDGKKIFCTLLGDI